MDDKRAALLLATLALAGAAVRFVLAPRGAPSSAAAPGDVRLTAPAGSRAGLRETARQAARLARPLAPGERIDLDRADVTEITRLPRVGPALAQRIVAWRTEHGRFGGLARVDSVPGVGPRLLDAIRPYVVFSGVLPSAP
ncbi:MAG: ComEA family DNA-binding protein [Gemmatimonadales bacterium]